MANYEIFIALARQLYRPDGISNDRKPQARSLARIEKEGAIEARVNEGKERVGKARRFNSDQRPSPIVDRAFKVICLQR